MSLHTRTTESLTLTHSYKYYIKDIDALSKYNIDQKLYKDICNTANKLIVDSIIETDEWLDMPYHLGQLRIRKRKIMLDVLKIDFGNLRKTGIKTYHLNEHNNEYYCRWYWNKRKCMVKNRQYYSFIPTRTNARLLSTKLKQLGKFINYWD